MSIARQPQTQGLALLQFLFLIGLMTMHFFFLYSAVVRATARATCAQHETWEYHGGFWADCAPPGGDAR